MRNNLFSILRTIQFLIIEIKKQCQKKIIYSGVAVVNYLLLLLLLLYDYYLINYSALIKCRFVKKALCFYRRKRILLAVNNRFTCRL